jgi:phage shock protein E
MKTYIASIAMALLSLTAHAKDVVIDVRTPQEFAAGHIAGAINIEYTTIGQQIAKAGVGKDDKVVLYCRTGRRSGIALDTLKGMGFGKAENAGGLEQASKTLAKK